MLDPSCSVALPISTGAEVSSSRQPSSTITNPAFAPWPPALRVAFRFCFVYFALFCLYTQIFTSLYSSIGVDGPDLYAVWPMRQIITWTAIQVFHIHRDLVFEGSGSGDKTTDWILFFLLIVISIVATAVWSFLDRRRTEYAKLHAYFRLFVRIALAVQLFGYGLWKAIPLQMPAPSLYKLLAPFGNSSPMGVLWASIGAAQPYEIFAGCAELAAAFLLIFPRTTTLGALVAMADMTQVFMLNMTYDVPVKIFSFHLLLLAAFLLAPDLPRLLTLLFRNQAVPPPAPSPIFRSRRASRIAFVVPLVYVAAYLTFAIYDARNAWYRIGGGRRLPPLYGIWDAEEYSVDGQSKPPLTTDADRWRRVVIRSDRFTVEKMDDSFSFFQLVFNGGKKTFDLSDNQRKGWHTTLTFQQPGSEELNVDGEIDAHEIHLHLHRIDVTKKFPLTSAKFHWINEYPVNQ
jgi:hypothetical protein